MVQAFPVPEGTPVLRVLLRRHRTSAEHLPAALPLLLWQTNRTAYSFSALLFPHFLNFNKPLFPYYPSPNLFVNSWSKFFRFQTAQPKNCRIRAFSRMRQFSLLLVRQQHCQNSLLDVEAVFGFREDLVGVLLKDGSGDLLAAVGGQTVEQQGVGSCLAHERTRDLKSREIPQTALALRVPGAVFHAAVTTTSASLTPSAGSVRSWNFAPYSWANISTSAAGR